MNRRWQVRDRVFDLSIGRSYMTCSFGFRWNLGKGKPWANNRRIVVDFAVWQIELNTWRKYSEVEA